MKNGIIAIVLVILAVFLLAIPVALNFGTPLASDMDDYFIHHGQEQAATNNIVTTVVFDYRGFDTLGESTVLFTAVIGVAIMFRKLLAGEEYEDE